MKIDRQKLEITMKKLDDLSFMVGDWHVFNMAMYMYMRYGEIDERLTDEHLEKIDRVLTNSETFFDEYINQDVEEIMDETYLLTDKELDDLADELRNCGFDVK